MNRFSPISSRFPHFIHGGDYNPDQWLHAPGILEDDIRLMKEANCNTMSVGIFAWAALEPAEGKYTFDWLDATLDRLADNNLYAVLATPSGAKPAWMAETYPEIRRVLADGCREVQRGRHNHCYTSPVYREKVLAINTLLAERYKNHPAVLVWHISNEYNGECHCDLCMAEWEKWLQARYGTLDTLNQAWWTGFWSHTYQAWRHVRPVDGSVDALMLNWKRFVTDRTVDFMCAEIAPLKSITPDIPITTNLMGTFAQLNYWKFVPVCDVMSWDSYPSYHDQPEDLEEAIGVSFTHDIYRSFKQGKPWMLMESTPSATNWMPVSKLKRPGVHQLASLQAVAHGADTVQYFQWRAGRGGHEKYHGSVVTHDATGDTRVFNDVKQIGGLLKKMDAVIGSTSKAPVAVIYDWENRWAIEGACGPRREKRDYLPTCEAHYRPFWQRGITVDVLDQEQSLDGYQLVIAPMLYMLKPGLVERLEAFVAKGGILVTTYWSGNVNEDDLCFLGGRPGPLRKLLGIWSEEIDVLYDEESVPVVFAGKAFRATRARIFCDLVHSEGAQILGTYNGEFYAGRPALTCHKTGAGKAYYHAFRADADFLDAFYAKLIKEIALKPALTAKLPTGVTARCRTNGDEDFIFLLNFSGRNVEITPGQAGLTDLATGRKVPTRLKLPKDGSCILRRKHKN